MSFDGTYLRTAGIQGQASVDGEGLGGVTATLVGEGEDRTETTNASGRYAFSKLKSGTYQVGISGYSPSRRSSSPISPAVSQASAFSTIESLYAAVNRRLVAFADTSGSAAEAAALRLPSPEERGVPFTFIPSPRSILHLSASPYSNLFLLSCLAGVGREGPPPGERGSSWPPSFSL